jgi:hypothetical protein
MPFAQAKAQREIFQISGRCEHHGMRYPVVLKGHRDFFGNADPPAG